MRNQINKRKELHPSPEIISSYPANENELKWIKIFLMHTLNPRK